MDVCGLSKFPGRYICASSYLGHRPRITRRELADGLKIRAEEARFWLELKETILVHEPSGPFEAPKNETQRQRDTDT